MSQNSDKKKIAETYAELVTSFSLEELNEERASNAASELGYFGLESNQFIERKLKTAEPAELRTLLKIVQHLNHPEIGEGLAAVVVERIVPLDLKVEFFEVMANLGYSIDNDFLHQMQEAEELYYQVGSYLNRSAEEHAHLKGQLLEQFSSLNQTLKLSFVQQLNSERGEKALPFLGLSI